MIKNPAKSGTSPHIPIMVKEVIQYLQISKTGTYIDCTIGYGGHAHQILKELSLSGKLIGIDKDEEAIKFCKKVSLLIVTFNYFIIPITRLKIFYQYQKSKRWMVCY